MRFQLNMLRVKPMELGPSIRNMDDYVASISPFERLMINRLDNMAYDQRNHYKFSVSRFQNLGKQIKVVQNQLFELQYGKEIKGFNASIYNYVEADELVFSLLLMFLFNYVFIHSLSLFVKLWF